AAPHRRYGDLGRHTLAAMPTVDERREFVGGKNRALAPRYAPRADGGGSNHSSCGSRPIPRRRLMVASRRPSMPSAAAIASTMRWMRSTACALSMVAAGIAGACWAVAVAVPVTRRVSAVLKVRAFMVILRGVTARDAASEIVDRLGP